MTATLLPSPVPGSSPCPTCGAAGQTERFCRQCGARLSEESAGEALTWNYRYNLLANPMLWWDILRVGLFSILIVQGLLVVMGLWLEGEAVVLPLPILGGIFLTFMLLFVIAALFVMWNRADMQYTVRPEGAGSLSGGRERRLTRILFWIGLLTLNPRLTGAALIAESQEAVAIDWRDVYRIKVHRRMRMVSISNGWRTVLRLNCQPDLFETVASRCLRYSADGAAWRAANAIPAPIPWGRILAWTLAALAVSLALTAWPGLDQRAALVGAGTVVLFVIAGWRSGRVGRWAGVLALTAGAGFAALLAVHALTRVSFPWGADAFAFEFDRSRLLVSSLAGIALIMLTALRVLGAGERSAPAIQPGGDPSRWPAEPRAPKSPAQLAVTSGFTLLLAGAAGTAIALFGLTMRPAVQGRVAGELREAVDGVQFSPDGRAVVGGTGSGSVVVWDIATGLKVQTVETSARAGALVVQRDGRTAYVGGASGCAVEQWDLATGTSVRSFLPEGTAERATGSTALALSADGRQIAAVCRDGSARVWDLNQGQVTLTVPAAARGVRVAAFSPDGRLLATGSADNTVRLWNTTGGEVRTFEGLKGEIDTVLVSFDGQLVIAATEVARDDVYVRAWQLVGGQSVGSVTWWDGRAPVALSPDGRTLAVDNGRTISLISTQSWQVEREINVPGAAGSLGRLVFSPDGSRLAGGGDDGQVTVWKVADGAVEQVLFR